MRNVSSLNPVGEFLAMNWTVGTLSLVNSCSGLALPDAGQIQPLKWCS